MNSTYTSIVHSIRRFNRFYTNVLGLLEQYLLDSEFSLSEARVLYELNNIENCTSKKLIEALRMDSGYLSRMMKRFEAFNLTYKVRSAEDGRLYFLYLTDKGRETLARLDALSDQQISLMVDKLQVHNQKKLVEGMEMIESAITDNPVSAEEKVSIRSEIRPGDIGYLIYLHGWIYAKECGYNHVFEGYVCKTFYEFLENYSPKKDRIWLAEANGIIIGAIGIVGHTSEKAQLRWFILHPDFRGMGLGKRLLSQATQYCREKGYRQVYLETTEDQKHAIHMYTQAGFRFKKEYRSSAWGVDHVELTYEWNLS
ncbi:helix-turn-helix domain-containing GNAT family N-acetyltransferase [Paenibacillus polymyxa]|uniref:bifunctional helix-turn-helix transcriptional regulator/GNAT family N-acetyltransferase n=1 Tax=Paenibacillus polymyxa TaxID=1406 RepID=UPI00307F907B